MNQTFQNSAQVLSVGIFFTLMIVGLSATLPHAMASGLEAHGVSAAAAHHAANLPPVSILFAAFLGYNPIQHLVGASALAHVPAHAHAVLTGRSFFPQLISDPFRNGLHEAFAFAIVACLVAAVASWSRGERYVDAGLPAPAVPAPAGTGTGTGLMLARGRGRGRFQSRPPGARPDSFLLAGGGGRWPEALVVCDVPAPHPRGLGKKLGPC